MILLNLVCLIVLRKYNYRKYVNTFKARSQTTVNKHNSLYGACFILFLLQMIWPFAFFNRIKWRWCWLKLETSMTFISGIINIIIQKIFCTKEIRVICFCPNCVLFLPEKVIFLFFAGDNCPLAHALMDTMKKLRSFDTCKSENHCLFRTF